MTAAGVKVASCCKCVAVASTHGNAAWRGSVRCVRVWRKLRAGGRGEAMARHQRAVSIQSERELSLPQHLHARRELKLGCIWQTDRLANLSACSYARNLVAKLLFIGLKKLGSQFACCRLLPRRQLSNG